MGRFTKFIIEDQKADIKKLINNPKELKLIIKTGEVETDTDAFDKLYKYFTDKGMMPYGVAKARTGDPVIWLGQQIQRIFK